MAITGIFAEIENDLRKERQSIGIKRAIAQGAKFEEAKISESVLKHCELIAKDLLKIGIDFIAFDILDEMVTEVNITCPGLVNEVSTAMEMNLADNYADYFLK